MDHDIFFMETRIKGIKEELRMLEEALDRVKNKREPPKYIIPEKMLDEIFKEIEVKTEGFIPVKWRKKGSTEWKKCIYSKRKQ